ncbi:MAG: hypothetical protein AAF202_12785 [Pseudomonadota bacterium]
MSGSNEFACGPSKVAQCNQFVEVVNKEKALSDAFFESQEAFDASGQDESALVNLATAAKTYGDEVGAIVEEVAALDLQDETVIDFQNRYVDSQTQLQEGIIETANAMEQIGTGQITTSEQFEALEQQMNESGTKVTEAEQEIEAIRTEYTAYCVEG